MKLLPQPTSRYNNILPPLLPHSNVLPFDSLPLASSYIYINTKNPQPTQHGRDPGMGQLARSPYPACQPEKIAIGRPRFLRYRIHCKFSQDKRGSRLHHHSVSLGVFLAFGRLRCLSYTGTPQDLPAVPSMLMPIAPLQLFLIEAWLTQGRHDLLYETFWQKRDNIESYKAKRESQREKKADFWLPIRHLGRKERNKDRGMLVIGNIDGEYIIPDNFCAEQTVLCISHPWKT